MMARMLTALRTFALLGIGLLTLPLCALAQSSGKDVSNISLDELADTPVTSVTRKQESLSRTAAAVFVITQEDIRRSGLTSIPELLRMVPGLDVARMDANKWAVTARGFNERYADKMLIMIDGRTVLDPLSSGVNWDVQNVLIEDIDRIEVVRGPGASLWGANAVNGIVNVITKPASATQGALVVERGGTQEHESGAVRYGGSMGNHGSFRLFADYVNRGPFSDANGHKARDEGNFVHGGFRSDFSISKATGLTLQGDMYSGSERQSVTGLTTLTPAPGQPFIGTFVDRTALGGGNVLGNWHHSSSDRFDTTAQFYAEYDNRDQPGVLGEFRHTLDLEFQQHLLLDRHDLVWGGDYRFAADRTNGSLNLSFDPAARATNLFGGYVQDEFSLLPGTFEIILGAKLEHNSYSGLALQPNFRALWTPDAHKTIWAGISQASENSSRMDADIRTNDDAYVNSNGVLTLVSNLGTHQLPPENVTAYELGYRSRVKRWLTLDTATFFNQYSNRHTSEPGTPFLETSPAPAHRVLPSITASNISGKTEGLELSATVKPNPLWRFVAGYTFFEIHLHASPGSQDTETAPTSEGSTPHHQVQGRLELNLPRKFEFDTAAYYVGSLPGPQIPSYMRLDLRLGWHPKQPIEISAGGQNLLESHHFEFGSADLAVATQIGRSAYVKAVFRF